MAMSPADAIHLEADIHATRSNQQGFQAGEWVPYLGVSYRVTKVGSDWAATGTLLPMVAKDGPHYAVNMSLNGPGQYQLTYHLDPPITQGFFRHTDADTGVAPWWGPFDVSWTFTYPSTPRVGTDSATTRARRVHPPGRRTRERWPRGRRAHTHPTRAKAIPTVETCA
jgi:uncharacterized protein involved in high-affinity Fe2+ transport